MLTKIAVLPSLIVLHDDYMGPFFDGRHVRAF